MTDCTQNQNLTLLNFFHDRPSNPVKQTLFAFFSLFITLFVIYANTFQVPFHFDDYAHIVHNKKLHLTELNYENVKQTFFGRYNSPGTLYRPVVSFTFALNYFLGRDDVAGYHLVNIAVHLTAAFFLFLFIFNTLKLPTIKDKYESNAYLIALLATMFWASSPVQTQAVTYIVQRMASMAGMFYIMAMYFYLKGRTSNTVQAKTLFLCLCLVSALLALGSKENAAMLPVSLMIYDLILICGISRKNLKKFSILFVLFAASLVAIGAVILNGNPLSLLSGYNIRPYSLSQRLLTEPRIIVFYISLLLYPMPARLNITHDIQLSHSLLNPLTTLVSFLFIAGLILLAVIISKKRPLLSFCIIFFFLNHIIESSVLPLELIYEHRNYLPSMLFFVPLAVLFVNALAYFSYKKSMQTIMTIFVILIIVGQGHAAYLRNNTWKSQERLWLDASFKSFYLSRPHMNLGKAYFDKGEINKAIFENELALKVNRYLNTTYNVAPHLNLIACYFRLQNFDKVIYHCVEAQKLNPKISSTYTDLAFALIEKGNLNAAVENLRKSISLNPNDDRAYTNLGRVLLEQRHSESAVAALNKALNLSPNNIEALTYLALAYKQKTEYPEAVRLFKTVLLQSPRLQSFENIYAKLGLMEVYYLTEDEASLRKTAFDLIQSVNRATLLNVVDKLFSDQKNGRALMDARMLLSELCKSDADKGEFCLRQVKP